MGAHRIRAGAAADAVRHHPGQYITGQARDGRELAVPVPFFDRCDLGSAGGAG